MAAELNTIVNYNADNAAAAIIDMIKSYPGFTNGFIADNTTVKWNNLNKTESIGIFQNSNALYKKKFIDGSFIGVIPFNVVYRSSPQSNKTSINAQETLKALAEYLSKCEMPYINNKTTLKGIEQMTNIYANSQDAKSTDYIVNMQLEFYEKG